MSNAKGQSVQRLARSAGILYLVVTVLALSGMFLSSKASVGATSAPGSILAFSDSMRGALVLNLLSNATYIVVTGLFYTIYRPVDRTLSFVAALFSLAGSAVSAASLFLLTAPLVILKDVHVAGMGAAASHEMALVFNELYLTAINVGIIFFGFYCLIIGWLTYVSGFLPRALGVGMMAAGIGYVTFLWPPLSHLLFPLNVLPGLIGENALAAWLIFKGVNEAKWMECNA